MKITKSKYKFQRKNNYSEAFCSEIKDLMKNHADILFIPNDKCFKAYYNGITLIKKLTDKSFSISGYNSDIVGRNKECIEKRWAANKKYFIDNYDRLIEPYDVKMPNDCERRTSQIIALNNMSFDPTTFSVCGWETTISTNDVEISGKKGGPEIDLVLLNPTTKRIIFVEYKCDRSSMFNGKDNIKAHFDDYKTVVASDAIGQIKQELIKAYRVLYDIKHLDKKSTFEIDMNPINYSVEIGFLFVDNVIIDERKACISDENYKKAVKDYKTIFDNDKLLYIRSGSYNNVKLSEWRNTKHSNLEKTQ